MLPEDERRLQREADIARSVRGPDNSELERSIALNKGDFQSRSEAQFSENARLKALRAEQFYRWLSVTIDQSHNQPNSDKKRYQSMSPSR